MLVSAVFEQWLQDVIALQCSIVRHLSIKQKASSAASTLSSGASPAEWLSGQKSCATSGDVKTQASLERTSSPDLCSKACTTPEAPPADPLAETAVCKCSTTPCQNCRKPNGPLAEECQPPKANGPVDCNSGSDSCRQADLQHRLKASTTLQDPAPAAGLANHIGAETIKKEPESVPEACAQKSCPAAPTIRPQSGQHNHRSQTEAQEESTSADGKARSDTAPKGNREQSPAKMGSSPPAPGKYSRVMKRICS